MCVTFCVLKMEFFFLWDLNLILMRSVKAHSHGMTTIATPIESRNWFHWSLLVCSHDATVTKTSSQNGFNGYQWHCSHEKEFCRSHCYTMWLGLYGRSSDRYITTGPLLDNMCSCVRTPQKYSTEGGNSSNLISLNKRKNSNHIPKFPSVK